MPRASDVDKNLYLLLFDPYHLPFGRITYCLKHMIACALLNAALQSALHALRDSVVRQYMLSCKCSYHVERLTIFTYIELEHAQPNQHVVLLGVVDRRGRYSNTKPTICSSRGQCCTISSKPKPVFAVFDSLVAITTHPGAQNSRSGRFRVNDNNNRRTKRLLYPLLRMRARGNNT